MHGVLSRFLQQQSEELGGGKKYLSMHQVVNFYTLLTPFSIALFMLRLGSTSTTHFIYLATHGSYSLFWVLREVFMPDEELRFRQTVGSSLQVSFFMLAVSVIGLPYVVCSQQFAQDEARTLFVALLLFQFGCFFMFSGGSQRHLLRKQGPKLTALSQGLFRISGSIDHLGEILVYLSFAVLSQHWAGYLLALVKSLSILLWMIVRNRLLLV